MTTEPETDLIVLAAAMQTLVEYDTSHLRAASESPIPWTSKTVTLLAIFNGVLRQATSVEQKRTLLADATGKDLVLVAWPGKTRQDIFVVDDLAAARKAVA